MTAPYLLASIGGTEISAVAVALISAATGLVGHRLGKRKRDADASAVAIDNISKANTHLEERVEWITKRVKTGEQTIDQLSHTVSSLETRNRSLTERMANLTLEVTVLRVERDAATDALKRATRERDQLIAKVEAQGKKIDQLEQEIKPLEANALPASEDGRTQTMTYENKPSQL